MPLGAGARRLVLWRHGRTTWNTENRFQGHTDVALDEVGVAQAERSARVLETLQPTVLVSSDLVRARHTAAVLARRTGLELRLDARLRETFGGRWQGRTAEEIRADDGPLYDAWRGGADLPAGGGESRSDVAARVRAAVDEVVRAAPADAVVVLATHGGTARAAIDVLLGLPKDCWAAIGGLANCAWSVLHELPSTGRPGPSWRLVEHNARSLPEPVLGEEG